jgi:HEPN domain-containing protein
MASASELKGLSRKRRRTVKMLLDGGDYETAVYMMALTLEIALKAASCKALRLESYPETNSPEDSYFKSHKFDRLLKVSGLSDVFSVRKPMVNMDAFRNWSEFTQAFVFADRDYTAMRYDPRMQANFTENKARKLYTALYEDKDSILKTMTGLRRW